MVLKNSQLKVMQHYLIHALAKLPISTNLKIFLHSSLADTMRTALQAPSIITTLQPQQVLGTSPPTTWCLGESTRLPNQLYQPLILHLKHLVSQWQLSSRLAIPILACLRHPGMYSLTWLTLSGTQVYLIVSEKAKTTTIWTSTFIGSTLSAQMSTCQVIS